VERMELVAEMRPRMTRGMLNSAREEDKVPAVLYGRGKETYSLVLNGRSLKQIIFSGGSNVLIDLQIQETGKQTIQETVMFKEIQKHIIKKDRLLHVDFIRISMTDEIEVHVQLNFSGEPAGVKEGGALQILTREIAVKCLPVDIPDTIDLDLSEMFIGDSITAGSIALAPTVKLITAPDELLAQVLIPAVVDEETKAAEDDEEVPVEEASEHVDD